MAAPPRMSLAAAILFGLIVMVATAVWIYSTDHQLNLLGPLAYGLLAGGALYVVLLLWKDRHRPNSGRRIR